MTTTRTDAEARAHARLHGELDRLDAAGVDTKPLRDAITRWVFTVWALGQEQEVGRG